MELVIERSAAAPMETTGDGWTLYGLAVPYGTESLVSDDGVTFYREVFSAGAFSRDVAKGARWVNLMVGHDGDDGDRYLGRCVSITEDSQGLWPAFRLDRHHPQAEAARAGELSGWSVSARVYRSKRETVAGQVVVTREQCGLSHVAATAVPQYAGAGVLVAREHVMVNAGSSTPRLDALRQLGYGKTQNDQPPQVG
jgi:HK97 family phage prohead protease